MTIKLSYPEAFTKIEEYRLTRNKTNQSMRNLSGLVAKPVAWVLYSDTDNTGVERDILAVEFEEADGRRVVGATNSEIFRRDFLEIANVFENNIPELIIETGVSAKKRTYISVGLA